MSKSRQAPDYPFRKINWGIILFFAITGAGTIFGMPFYLYRNGFVLSDWLIFSVYFTCTGLSITSGYHRMYAHRTYKAHPAVEFVLLFFGAAAFEQSALKWASQHRNHHFYLDTELDPYSVTKGFWHAHMGWLIAWQRPANFENVADLRQSPLVRHQHEHFYLWAFGSGVVLPVLLGGLTGHALGAFLIAVCFRLVLVQQSTFCINSLCHLIGNASYDSQTSARDHWLIALLTFGEGYHNFHHRFPSDYRNGIRWYHWDPSKWTISLLSKLRLAYDLRRTPYFHILHARLATQNRKVQQHLSNHLAEHPNFLQFSRTFETYSKKLQDALSRFQLATAEYQKLASSSASASRVSLGQLKETARQRLRDRREAFRYAHQAWLNYARAFGD